MSVEGVVYGLQVEGDILTCHHWGGPDLVQNTVTSDRPEGALAERAKEQNFVSSVHNSDAPTLVEVDQVDSCKYRLRGPKIVYRNRIFDFSPFLKNNVNT